MQYSISDLEKFSGISVHNIRIWERRYGALTPLRTAGNTRFYDDDQLRRLLSIAGLYYSGYKISHACKLSNSELSELLKEDINNTISQNQRYEYIISQIVNNCLIYNELKISSLISSSFEQDGVLNTYKFVIYPLLVRIGLMWLNGNVCPSQEHFLSQIIRQKLFAAIDNCDVKPNTPGAGWLLFLPEDEDHDIPLLLANYVLRSEGERVTYLGARVPLTTLHNTVAAVKPQRMLFFMTRLRPQADAQSYLNSFSNLFTGVPIYVSGNQRVLRSLVLPENVKLLETPVDFEDVIKNTKP